MAPRPPDTGEKALSEFAASRLDLVPAEIKARICEFLDSSSDLSSLQNSNPAFDAILTSEYLNQILSSIAVRRWAPKGGLPFLDMICNGLVNERLRRAIRSQDKAEVEKYGCDLYFQWKLDQPWPSFPPKSAGTSINEGAKFKVTVGFAILEQMDVIEERVIQPLLHLATTPELLRLKVGSGALSEAFLSLSRSDIEQALFLLFGSYKHFHEIYKPTFLDLHESPEEPERSVLGVPLEVWHCGFHSTEFMREFNLENHWRMMVIGHELYRSATRRDRAAEPVSGLAAIFDLHAEISDRHIVMGQLYRLWHRRVSVIWQQIVAAGLVEQVLSPSEMQSFTSYFRKPNRTVIEAKLQQSCSLGYMVRDLWRDTPVASKCEKMIKLIQKLSLAHKQAQAKLAVSERDFSVQVLMGIPTVPAIRVFHYTHDDPADDPFQRISIARAM